MCLKIRYPTPSTGLSSSGWWFFATLLKNDGVRQLAGMMTFPMYGKSLSIHVPNHQPVIFLIKIAIPWTYTPIKQTQQVNIPMVHRSFHGIRPIPWFGCFLSHGGTPVLIRRWDFSWNKPSSYCGTLIYGNHRFYHNSGYSQLLDKPLRLKTVQGTPALKAFTFQRNETSNQSMNKLIKMD